MGFLRSVFFVAAFGVAYLLSAFDPSFQPVAHKAASLDPQFVDTPAVDMTTRCAVLTRDAVGAEDFAFQGDFAFTGLHNGSVVRFSAVDATSYRPHHVAVTAGIPLGLRFHPTNPKELIVCVYSVGLVSIDVTTGEQRVRISQVDGQPIKFIDHVVLSRDGTTGYFSDASTKYGMDALSSDLWEGRPHGRIIKFDTRTFATSVVADGLYFANGVYLTEDEQHLLVSETFAMRITKIDLRTGRRELFLGSHPIDNISPSGKPGEFWLAAVGKNDPALGMILESAFLRRVMRKLPLPVKPFSAGFLVNEQGRVLKHFEDKEGKLLDGTSVYASHGDKLFVGSFKVCTCINETFSDGAAEPRHRRLQPLINKPDPAKNC